MIIVHKGPFFHTAIEVIANRVVPNQSNLREAQSLIDYVISALKFD